MKRLIPLLAIIAIVFTFVPEAKADHCVRCRHYIDYSLCEWGVRFGATDCEDWTGACYTSGDSCSHPLASAALSSELMVASVERIDEPATPADTLVARTEVSRAAVAQR